MIFCHLISNRWNSAICEYALSMGLALRHLGYHSIYICLPEAPIGKRAQAKGFDVLWEHDFSWQNLRFLRHQIAKIKPNYIICYGGKETFLARFLPKKLPKIRFKGEIGKSGFFLKMKTRLALTNLSMIISPALWMSKELSLLGIKAQTIPLGVDAKSFYWQGKTEKLDYSQQLLIVGRLDPVKGHLSFLKLFARVKATYSDMAHIRLVIVGEAANLTAKQISSALASLGLSLDKDVEIVERKVFDLCQRMNQAVLGVIPSLGSEFICRVGAEFLLCGTPILVSGAGSTEELLFLEAGLSYAGKSEEEAVFLLYQLIKNSANESQENRQKRAILAQKSFSIEAMALRLKEILVHVAPYAYEEKT